jgi:predicted nucleic acid-binding protein
MYLIDTNVWLERLLDQERGSDVARFLARIPSDRLAITGFAFHSIALVLIRLNRLEVLRAFVQDLFLDGAVRLIRLEPNEILEALRATEDFRLDFDDAYPYVAAEKHGLILVSFDADFDRTPRGRRTPAQVLAALAAGGS